jgi:hypothetical protein
MARKTSKRPDGPRTRKRRTDDELIHDLQVKIQKIKERAVARSMKRSPSMKHTAAAVRAIDKALEHAAGEGNTTLRHALADAREPLAAYLQLEGVKLPKVRRPKGPRPKPAPEPE